jgi:transposase
MVDTAMTLIFMRLTLGFTQREHELREVFNGLGWLVRAGAPWRLMPNDLVRSL